MSEHKIPIVCVSFHYTWCEALIELEVGRDAVSGVLYVIIRSMAIHGRVENIFPYTGYYPDDGKF